MSEAVPGPSPRTIPGKLFAIPFAVVVLFLLWLVFSMAVRFQTIMQQLERTRSAWPAASASLFERYESLLAEDVKLDDSLRSRIRTDLQDARKVTQFDQQSPLLYSLEQSIQEDQQARELVDRIGVADSVLEVLRLDKERSSLQSDFVGQATVNGLRLKLPPVFDLHVNSSHSK